MEQKAFSLPSFPYKDTMAATKAEMMKLLLTEEDGFYPCRETAVTFDEVKKEENLPKKIWDSNIFSKKELRKQLGILESKWPRKIMDFDEEFVLKILSLCDNNWIKCQKYISSNIFKSLLQGMKAKKEELTINLFK